MKTRDAIKGMFLLMTIVLMACAGFAQTASSSSASASTLTPTNMVLDYDLTRIDSNLKPGDSGLLQVVIKNSGGQAAENVVIYIPETGNVKVNKRFEIGRVESLASKTVSTTIGISKDAYIGLHTIQVRITYDGYDKEGDRDNNQQVVWEFPVRVYGSANFQVGLDRNASFFKDVTSTLYLAGTTKDGARDVSATLSSSCASVVGSSKSYIGTLGKNDEFGAEYMIKPTAVGTCILGLVMNYSDASGNAMQETLSLGINVERRDVDFKVIDVEYSNVTPGTVSSIKLVVENVGGDSAEDVTFDMGFTDPFTAIGSSEKYVKQIKSHETVDVEFKVLVDAAAEIKAYNIPLSIDYFDSAGTENTATKSVGVEVSGKPDIKIIIEEADLFAPNARGKLTIDVINKGFAEVKFLDIKLLSTEDYEVTSADEVYIGNLDSDSTDSQEFEIQVKNVQPGKIPLRLEARYKEKNSNVDHVEPFELEVTVLSMQEYASKQPAGSPINLLITVVGALVGLVVAFVSLWFVYKLVALIISFLDRKLFKKNGRKREERFQ